MILAEKVIAPGGKEWIQASFSYDADTANAMVSITGAVYRSAHRVWLIPYENRAEFEDKAGDFLIIWTDGNGEADGNGGIDETMIPDQPVVPGYSVTYDDDHNIIAAEGFKTKPWGEFQVKGFNLLASKNFVILADDAGLGKSFQVATAIEAKKKLGEVSHGLIVAKASLLYNWRDEIQMHTNTKAKVIAGSRKKRLELYDEMRFEKDWTFAVMSYETFRADLPALQLVDNHTPLDFCVLDEAHKIKNAGSQIGAAVHKLPFKVRFVLTATPIINTPLDSFNYLKFGKRMDLNQFEFEGRYAVMGGFAGREIKGYRNMKELKQLLQVNMLRRRKQDKLKDLPSVTFRTIPLPLSKEQAKLYRAVQLEIMEDLKDTSLERIPTALSKLMRLQQITDSPELIDAPATKNGAVKLTALDELLEDLTGSGEKVIVFSRFKSMVHIMEKRYAAYNPAVIHGDVDATGKSESTALRAMRKQYPEWQSFSAKQKQDLIDDYATSERQKQVYKFQKDDSCKVFIGCTPACREGLTLTAATHVIFVDKEWSPAYVEQAFSRAHRIGQKNAVTVHTLICEGTIDEKVEKVLARKESIAQTLVDDGLDAVDPMSAKELIQLLSS